MTDLKIKRGLSTVMFISPGVINPRLVIEEGYWYLCTDTAALYLGVIDSVTNKPTLKRINGDTLDDPSDFGDLDVRIKELEQSLLKLDETELYQRITAESDLPSDFEAETFNPNIVYYIPLGNNKISTYVFDRTAQSYMCTNSIDELVIRAMVSEAIDSLLANSFEEKIPQMLKQTLEVTILHGGDANPND